MLTLAIRSIIIYSVVITVFRLMGKRQIGQMQPFELVLTLIIADLATIPMGESAIPMLHGLVSLLTLVIAHYVLTVITKKSERLNKVISGKPFIIINPNGIDYENLKKLNLSLDDVFESIRGSGYFSLEEIEYAVVETNGLVNVLAKRDFSPITIGDISKEKNTLKLKDNQEKIIPITLIAEGKINNENMTILGYNKQNIEKLLKIIGAKKTKDVLVLTMDSNGKIYSQLKNSNYQIFNVNKEAI